MSEFSRPQLSWHVFRECFVIIFAVESHQAKIGYSIVTSKEF